MEKSQIAVALGATILLVVGGCSSSPAETAPALDSGFSSSRQIRRGVPEGTPAGTQVVRVSADDSLHFNPSLVKVKPGRMRLIFTATGGKSQNLTLKQLGVSTGNVLPGETVTVDVIVPRPGRYGFASAYYGHNGMSGTIVASR